MRYRRLQEVEYVEAATYHYGRPIGEVLAIARMHDAMAQAVEVPEWRVLLVRYTHIDDYGDHAYKDYEVVPDGQMLCYGRHYNVLWVNEPEQFDRRGWELVQ